MVVTQGYAPEPERLHERSVVVFYFWNVWFQFMKTSGKIKKDW